MKRRTMAALDIIALSSSAVRGEAVGAEGSSIAEDCVLTGAGSSDDGEVGNVLLRGMVGEKEDVTTSVDASEVEFRMDKDSVEPDGVCDDDRGAVDE